MTTLSDACCSTSPVLVDYTAKGTYKPYADFDRVYVTGDSSETALIVVYDIFGYFSQTIQGADILAKALGVKVFMPDFLGKNTFPIDKFPVKDEDTRKELQEFIGGPANIPITAEKLDKFAKALKSDGFKKTGALGYCWGGKVVVVSALQEGSRLDAISIVHPSITVDEAKRLPIPLGFYYSGDESREDFDSIVDALSEKSQVDSKYYSNMFHGWAAARANLSDPDNKREYEDLYSRAAAFFRKALAQA